MWSLAIPEVVDGHPTVLVIVENPQRRAEYAKLLTSHGLDPVVPPTRRAALTRLRYVELAVIELGVGDAEGWELCRTIRKRASKLPIIAITEGTDETIIVSVFSTGADDHMARPLREHELIARIRARIKHGREERRTLRTAERYGQLVKGAAVPLFILENGWFSFANIQLSDFVGLPESEIVSSRTIHDLIVEEERFSVARTLQRFMDGREGSIRLTTRVMCYGGEDREVEMHLYRIPGEAGGICVGTFVDINRRRKAIGTGMLKEDFFGSLIGGAHESIAVLDQDGSIRYASPSVQKLLGKTLKELNRVNVLSLLHKDDARPVQSLIRRMLVSSESAITSRCRVRNAQGEWRVVEFSARDLGDHPAVHGIVVNARDITEQQAAEIALRESEERFRLIVEESRDVFFYVRSEERKLAYLSPSVSAVLGYEAGDLIGSLPEWLPESEQTENGDSLADESCSRLVTARHREGRPVTLELVESPMPGTAGGVQGFARDVSEREEMQETLRNAVFLDRLTGLPNRALFIDRVNQAIARMKRNPDAGFALLFLDLDRFKIVNDSLGHVVGDHLLVAVADRLREHLRPEDTLARFGGDEFAILIQDLPDAADATRVAQRTGEVLATPFMLEGFEVYTSTSIGIVLGSAATTPESLLRNADMAMYRAKTAGGATFAIYDTAMHAEAVRRLNLESQLRRSLERDELRLFFQPIIRLGDGTVAGAEALIRWEHPHQGLLAPAGFIGLAEETGFITSIGSWVLEAATDFLAEWQNTLARPDFFVSVNLSARQLRDSSLVPQVKEAIARKGIRPETLRLEITENILIDGAERAALTLRELMKLGIQIYLDDFGTGYASMSFLNTLPLSGLKIDRSFVERMHTDERYAVLVESTVALAKGLGLTVIAEGVEEPAQASALLALDCELAQGYYYSRPIPAEELPAITWEAFA